MKLQKYYELDPQEIREILQTREWKITRLVKESGLSLRSIRKIVSRKKHRRCRVFEYTALKVANTLGIPLSRILARTLYLCGGSWLGYENIHGRASELFKEALRNDMAGNHFDAIGLCEQALIKLDPDELRGRVTIQIKIAVIHSHTGKHRRSIELLDQLLASFEGKPDAPNDLLKWAQYHRAIPFRRLKEFHAAESTLQPLLQDAEGELLLATRHQLGVVRCHEFLKTRNKDLFEQARSLINESRIEWRRQGNHREGFSWRRLGQLYAVQGNLRAANHCFLRASGIFELHGCRRHKLQIDKDVAKYIDRHLPGAIPEEELEEWAEMSRSKTGKPKKAKRKKTG